MLKKYFIYIIIFILTLATLWAIRSNTKSSIKSENKFSIEDTSIITKIFLADRNGNTLKLNKENEKWKVNNQYDVRPDAIEMLLSSASKIRIKKPVPKAALENVIKFMATTGVYIEFFEKDKMIKSYMIGSNTPDHLGTYMLLIGKDKPFVMHIPHFNGFLSPRYGIQLNAIDLNHWRSTNIFSLSSDSVHYLKYTNLQLPENSFTICTNPIKLIDVNNQSISFNNVKILKLLNSFKNLNCETYKNKKLNINDLIQLEELIVNSDTLRTYKISKNETKSNENNFTVARKYAILNNGDLMLIQDYVFNKVLINITELIE